MYLKNIKIAKVYRYLLLSCFIFAGLFSIISTEGCGSSGTRQAAIGSRTKGILSVSLADVATDEYRAVYITIKEVSVHESVNGSVYGATGSWKVIARPDKTYNLLDLVNNTMKTLGIKKIDAGHYTRVRLKLGLHNGDADNSKNILGAPHPYANYVVTKDNKYEEIKVPSFYKSGIKLSHAFDLDVDATVKLVLDFDALKSIVKTGKSNNLMLKPKINVMRVKDSKIIAGRVLSEDGTGIPGVYVSAQTSNPNAYDPKNEVTIYAGTITDTHGNFSLRLHPPDTYYYLVAYKDNYSPACKTLTFDLNSKVAEQDLSLTKPEAFGTVSGNVHMDQPGEDQSADLSFRQAAQCGNAAGDQIEVTWANIADGGKFNVTLPKGKYSLVASTANYNTQVHTVDTSSTANLNFSLDFPLE